MRDDQRSLPGRNSCTTPPTHAWPCHIIPVTPSCLTMWGCCRLPPRQASSSRALRHLVPSISACTSMSAAHSAGWVCRSQGHSCSSHCMHHRLLLILLSLCSKCSTNACWQPTAAVNCDSCTVLQLHVFFTERPATDLAGLFWTVTVHDAMRLSFE